MSILLLSLLIDCAMQFCVLQQQSLSFTCRAFDHIFETVSVRDRCQFLIHASYLEIYNEEIRDLLGNDTKAKLELKEHPEKGVYVAGFSFQFSTANCCNG